jgi:hypothetical protein
MKDHPDTHFSQPATTGGLNHEGPPRHSLLPFDILPHDNQYVRAIGSDLFQKLKRRISHLNNFQKVKGAIRNGTFLDLEFIFVPQTQQNISSKSCKQSNTKTNKIRS